MKRACRVAERRNGNSRLFGVKNKGGDSSIRRANKIIRQIKERVGSANTTQRKKECGRTVKRPQEKEREVAAGSRGKRRRFRKKRGGKRTGK